MTALDITVLNLLAQGRSNENIAREVCRSPHTVKDMVKRRRRFNIGLPRQSKFDPGRALHFE
jgi:DNA-binding CsgD family transcriptional regulator